MRVQDPLWSAQSDQQLIGRLWRFMQQYWVLVYRLIIDNSQDVFLNNVSFSKKQMHLAFLGVPSELRTSFTLISLKSI